MKPEDFQDAMNFVNDDLIQETDDLRQGRRVLYRNSTARQIGRILAPVACVALLLAGGAALLPRLGSTDSAAMQDMANGSAEHGVVQDGALEENYGVQSGLSTTSTSWKTVALDKITLSLPDGWEYETTEEDDGSYRISFRPDGTQGQIVVGYYPSFGVCGTGLETVKTEIAGIQATVGIYDGKDGWDYITFQAEPRWYVALNEAVEFWWEDHRDTVAQILETIVIEEG